MKFLVVCYSCSITKERTEVIFQGTNDNATDPGAQWLEYEFKCKPGQGPQEPIS